MADVIAEVQRLILLFYQDLLFIRREPDAFLRLIHNNPTIEDVFSINSIARRVANTINGVTPDIIYRFFLYLINNSILLGDPGGFGIPYRIGNYYMKRIRLPINNTVTYVVDYTPTNKQLIRIPAHYIEYFIGIILSNYVPNTCTPSFMNTYCLIRGPNNDTYTIYELLTPLAHRRFGHINNEPYNINKVYYSIFQILFALHNAQKTCHFVHNDLHSGNIMARRYASGRSLKKYVLAEGRYVYTNMDFDTVIIDYGVSRLESESFILTNVNHDIIGQHQSTERFEFNPYIDITSFLLQISINDLELQTRQIAERLLRILLIIPEDITIDQFMGMHNLRTVAWWRMNARNLRLLPNIRLSVFDLIRHMNIPIDNGLELQQGLFDDDVIVESSVDLDDTIFQRIYINISVTSPGNGSVEGDKNAPIVIIRDQTVLATAEAPFNFTVNDTPHFRLIISNYFNNRPIPVTHQNGYVGQFGHNKIYHAIMNQQDPTHTFQLECCHVDGISYLEDERIEEGVVINAAFFNIFTDFENVGETFIDRPSIQFQSNHQIPNEYRPYYHQIIIENNRIIINPFPVSSGPAFSLNTVNASAEFYSGPLLINGGIRIFTDNAYQTVNNDVHIFQCEPGPLNVPVVNRNGIHVKNCNNPPGELFHAANMNPRSALVITNDNNVHFVTVPGRTPGISNGMTLSEFSLYLITYFPNINMAINLDGGGSSRISVKQNGSISTFFYNNGPEPARPYPVGSILSFVRMRPAVVNPFHFTPPRMVHFQGGKRLSKKNKNMKQKRRCSRR